MKEKLEKIYEVIADKELRFWCKFLNIYNWKIEEVIVSDIRWWNFYAMFDSFKTHFPHTSQISNIIWHPVLIWDILNYLEINRWEMKNRYTLPIELFVKWKKKTLPIENQSDDCIEYVYWLIK